MSVKKERGVLAIGGINADTIKAALKNKHSKDLVVTECKNGDTWYNSNLLKMDVWALVRTWSPSRTVGYEIKVSRSDFEQDQKWTGYFDYCHEFYFVCPAGLIRGQDLPQNIGLIWVSAGGRLFTKRKAEYHKPDNDKLVSLLTYVLMSRVVANDLPVVHSTAGKLDAYRQLIEDCRARKELAYFVKGYLRELDKELRKKQQDLVDRESDVQRFADQLKRLGITWDPLKHDWQESERVKREIDVLRGHVDDWQLRQMRDGAERMLKVVEEIETMRQGVKNDQEQKSSGMEG